MREPTTASYRTRVYESATRIFAVTRHNMAVQDWLVAAFHFYMWLRVTAAPESADAQFAQRLAFTLFTATLCTIFLVRGEILGPGWQRGLFYRVGLFAPLVLSYFELRWLLPALQQPLLDAELLAIDQLLFGITPAVWLAKFNFRPVVEWFSFFYYSYFYVLGSVLLPTLFFDRGRRQQELLYGTLIVCITGHVTYTLVPGLGPWGTLGFEEPLHGGMFFDAVWRAVDRAGAMLDIFPSLHTAYPSFFALFAFTHRERRPYKYVWPVLAFITVNMVIATLFLRWHWAIDVLAGLLLAIAAHKLAVVVTASEQRRRYADDTRQPVWDSLWPGTSS